MPNKDDVKMLRVTTLGKNTETTIVKREAAALRLSWTPWWFLDCSNLGGSSIVRSVDIARVILSTYSAPIGATLKGIITSSQLKFPRDHCMHTSQTTAAIRKNSAGRRAWLFQHAPIIVVILITAGLAGTRHQPARILGRRSQHRTVCAGPPALRQLGRLGWA